jgi:hypothetical protein
MGKERQLKCYWCKNLDSKINLKCEEKLTGKYNKDNTPKMSRRYIHLSCEKESDEVKEMKQKEVKQWNDLYETVKKIHSIDFVDTRMIKKLQDLRNGTLSVSGKQLVKYKQGIPYHTIEKAYLSEREKIEYWLKNKPFDTKYNEFAYCFAIMEQGINEVIEKEMKLQKHNEQQKRFTENINQSDDGIYQFDVIPRATIKRKDELDLSDVL